jgi:hypothetical protein
MQMSSSVRVAIKHWGLMRVCGGFELPIPWRTEMGVKTHSGLRRRKFVCTLAHHSGDLNSRCSAPCTHCEYNAFYEYLMARSGLEFLLSPSFYIWTDSFSHTKPSPRSNPEQKSQSIQQFSSQKCLLLRAPYFLLFFWRVYFWNRDAKLFVEMRIEKSPRETRTFSPVAISGAGKVLGKNSPLILNTICDDLCMFVQ